MAKILQDNDANWETPFGGFSIGKPFVNPSDVIEDLFQKALYDGTTEEKRLIAELISLESANKDAANTTGASESSGTGRTYAYENTEIGGCAVINPVWQFAADDDIVPPINQIANTGTGTDCDGMGRVYTEMYYHNQHILWLSFGMPKYQSLRSFYSGAIDKKLARVMNSPDASIGEKIATVIGAGIALAITFGFAIIVGAARLIDNLAGSAFGRVNRYYDMKPAMHRYFKVVNTILAILCVNMDFALSQDQIIPDKKVDDGDDEAKFKEINKLKDDPKSQFTDTEVKSISDNMPQIIKDGPDILKILSKRGVRRRAAYNEQIEDGGIAPIVDMASMDKNITEGLGKTTALSAKEFDKLEHEKYGGESNKDEAYSDDSEASFGETIAAGVENIKKVLHHTGYKIAEEADKHLAYALGELAFIGFRIGNGTSTSESVSNSSSESEIASNLKSKAAAAKKKRFNISGGKTGFAAIDGAVNVIDSFTTEIASAFGLDALDAVLSKGSGYIDIPEVWSDSSFSKSYSFDLTLRAKYADPVTIYQSIYIPMALLMAASFPLGIGKNAYTSPFLVQAFSRGMFSVPLGMIDSMSIKRGASEYGWTHDKLPTSVDISISIKDLSPAMFLSMTDMNIFEFASGNTVMQDYISTMAGITLADRSNKRVLGKRKRKITRMLWKSNTFNMAMFTHSIQTSRSIKGIASFATRGSWRVGL